MNCEAPAITSTLIASISAAPSPPRRRPRRTACRTARSPAGTAGRRGRPARRRGGSSSSAMGSVLSLAPALSCAGRSGSTGITGGQCRATTAPGRPPTRRPRVSRPQSAEWQLAGSDWRAADGVNAPADKRRMSLRGTTDPSACDRRPARSWDRSRPGDGDASAIRARGFPACRPAAYCPTASPATAGPLAGVAGARRLGPAAARSSPADLRDAAADTPFFPTDLGRGAAPARPPADTPAMARARAGPRRGVPTAPSDLRPLAGGAARRALARGAGPGVRKVVAWTEPRGCARAIFLDRGRRSSTSTPPEDLARRGHARGRARMRLYGVTGWKNSGKTTLVERLVAEITGRGLTVSTAEARASRLRRRPARQGQPPPPRRRRRARCSSPRAGAGR